MKKKDMDRLMLALEEGKEFDELIDFYNNHMNFGADIVTQTQVFEPYDEDVEFNVKVRAKLFVGFDEVSETFYHFADFEHCDFIEFVDLDDLQAQVEKQMEKTRPRMDIKKKHPKTYGFISRTAKKIGLSITDEDVAEVIRRIASNLNNNGGTYNYGRDLVRG